MQQTKAIVAPAPSVTDAAEMFLDVGLPDHNRRLTDKILAAFNHAYSVGQVELAERLRDILAEAERRAQAIRPDRRNDDASRLAGLWMAFVEARNRYRDIKDGPDSNPAAEGQALEAMKEAYKCWSAG